MKHKKLKKALIAIALVLILCCGGIGIYAADYYRMDDSAVTAMADSDAVTVTNEKGLAVFSPAQGEIGFIFYPGGKVEYTAYAPLMKMLAENGILCVIPHMPLNLAVMNVDFAEKISAQFPEIDTWYIGGHSLGGSMAASHASHCSKVKGLVLLAAYSTADLTESGLQVLSIYGTRDGVLNMEKYNEYRSNLPAETTEILLEGGNHAQFGSYGVQAGDGNALIGEWEQQVKTMSQILQFTGLSEAEAPTYEEEQYIFWMEREGKSTLRSKLTLIPEEEQFYLSVNPLSSQFIWGTYTIESGVLTCTTQEEGAVYCFDVTDSGMVYRAADSSDIYAHPSLSGTDFSEAPVPDGALYCPLNGLL